MAKYRIVAQLNPIDHRPRYYAQHKLLNLFWVDIDRDYFDLRDGKESISVSSNVEHVERYIQDLMSGRPKAGSSLEIVKTYD